MSSPNRLARIRPGVTVLLLAACTSFGSTVRADHPGDSLALVYEDGMGNSMPYRLFLPPGYDTPGAEFPLVLRLHGGGGRGDDNVSQLQGADGLIDATQSERFASFLLMPQAPNGGGWTLGHHENIINDFGDALGPSMELVTQIITTLESQYQIDTARRYVLGFSIGGFGTWDLITKRPDMFAAAVPIAGGGNPSRAADFADVPLWAFHGRLDGVIGTSWSRNMIEALDEFDSDPLYLEPFTDHGIWQTIYEDPSGDMYPWMFEGVTPRLATAIYNPDTGNLKLDARSAPGGTIDDFVLESGSWTLQPTMTVDGTVVDTTNFVTSLTSRKLVYNTTESGGFSGIADFGPVMPTGLSLAGFHQNLYHHDYSSPATADELRTFRLLLESSEPTFTADFDEDGDVDGSDFLLWQTSFGVDATGDADGDGDTDGADFLAWQTQFGSGFAAGAASVPEPATACLTGLATLAVMISALRGKRA